jgi:hypothetical protein
MENIWIHLPEGHELFAGMKIENVNLYHDFIRTIVIDNIVCTIRDS